MRKKRIIAALFAAVAVVAFAGSAFAAFWTDEGNYDTSWYDDAASGVGSSLEKPYVISTAEELAGLSYMMQDDTTIRAKYKQEKFADKYIVLANDIDLSKHEWRPIGNWSFSTVETNQTIYFKGTFDGLGHKITGLNITNKPSGNYDSCGMGLFAEPGGVLDSKHEIRNFYIEGKIIPGDGQKWPYAGLVYGAGIYANIKNVVASGDVKSNMIGYLDGDAGILGGTTRGGSVKNIVTYGTAAATETETAGGITGRGGQTSTAFKGSLAPTYLNCVSLASSVKGKTKIGAGITAHGNASPAINAASKNNAFLTGAADQPTIAVTTSAGAASSYMTTPEAAKGIANESEVKVTAVMLDSKALATTPPAGSDTVIPLEYYPIGANSDDIKATWTFDDEDVKVKSTNKGFATVSSATKGTKTFTVVVKGLNGSTESDSVTLKGEITFSDKPIDDPADGEQTTEDDDITLDDISHDSSVAEIEKVDTANDPDDIRKVDAGETAPMDILSSKLDDTNRIAAISNIKPLKTILISIAPADGSTESDLELSIKLGISPTAGKSILALIKPNGSDIYDAFTATCENGVVKFTIKNFRNYFGGIGEAEISAKAAAVERSIVFVEADVETKSDSASSSGGSCGAGAASLAAFAAIALLKRKKS